MLPKNPFFDFSITSWETYFSNIVEFHLSGYAENLDNWIFFENRLHWQFEVRLLLCTVCTWVQTFRPRLI